MLRYFGSISIFQSNHRSAHCSLFGQFDSLSLRAHTLSTLMAKAEDTTTMKDKETEARRLKSIAATKFSESDIASATKHAKKAHGLCPTLDGIYSMLTAFKTLSATASGSAFTDWYKVLQVEPFSNINKIKKQYKKLALLLHPDRNPHPGCEEAFKLVGEAFRVLSDEIRRKEYDVRFRIRLQEEMAGEGCGVETFWTACSSCRLLHQFERKYLEHNLVCPNCKRSFKAVEVDGGDREDEDEDEEEEEEEQEAVLVGVRIRSARLKEKIAKVGNADKVGDGQNGGRGPSCQVGGGELKGKEEGAGEKMRSVGLRRKAGIEKVAGGDFAGNDDGREEAGGGRLRAAGLKRKVSSVDDVLGRAKLRRVRFEEETMTLAEMQLKVKKKSGKVEEEVKGKEEVGKKEKENEKGREQKNGYDVLKNGGGAAMKESGISEKGGDVVIGTRGAMKKSQKLENEGYDASKNGVNLKTNRRKGSRNGDLVSMVVEDFELHDFGEDKDERSLKKGQVWALYDDDDEMPRHYCVIDEVLSLNPFKVKLIHLDLDNNGTERLLSWEETGLPVSCGRFKMAGETICRSLNIFSHVMDCERAAREAYHVYPKKGSIWAMFDKSTLGAERGNVSARTKRFYDIVLFFTTYSEIHGLSMVSLEKVNGFETVFKRREFGPHAVKFLKKDDLRLISHQIPARKLSSEDVPDLLKDCWELDPASVPADLRTNC